nr:EOG090X04U5 [Lepidurus arcticus]
MHSPSHEGAPPSCPFASATNGKSDGPVDYINENEFDEASLLARKFHILDEIGASNTVEDDKSHDEGDLSDETDSDTDSDVPQDEIDAMLDEGLAEDLRARKRRRKDSGVEDNSEEPTPYEEREKLVLEEKGQSHFEVLPEGWVIVTHNSGMPVYLHKTSRVCTLSKPYFLGPGSARKHQVPLSAIPCMQYRAALTKEAETPKIPETQEEPGQPSDKLQLPKARIETVLENQAHHSLNCKQVREYCEKLFHFKKIQLMRFKSWSARRKYTKQRKHAREWGTVKSKSGRPTLPEDTKLITFPIASNNSGDMGEKGEGDGENKPMPRKEWIMNPAGKSYVCILHEYVQHALKKQPSYQFKEIENAATPYSATVLINGMQYGTGFGSSKKAAKAEAARATLEVLIPDMKLKILSDSPSGSRGAVSHTDVDLTFFDNIKIEDPRVAELCAKTSEPSPYAILLTCLQRNFGLGDKNVKYELTTLKHQKNEVVMTVGKHTVRVQCKNKRDGKQRAAQAILKALHPHIWSWGSLLRLYGSHSLKSVKEKKQEEQQITLLQSKAAANAPNFAILDKLRYEMTKLKERREAMQPIGTFVPPDDVGLPTSSGADLHNVDL